MKYTMSDYVVVYTNDVKQIDFIEEVSGVNIYYMKDNTSYAEHQIISCASVDDLVLLLINKISSKEIEIFPQEVKNSFSEWCKKYVK